MYRTGIVGIYGHTVLICHMMSGLKAKVRDLAQILGNKPHIKEYALTYVRTY